MPESSCNTQTFASCLVRKSIKPKPLWFPVPAAFFGRRTVFSSPNVLKGQKEYIKVLLNYLTPNFFFTKTFACERLMPTRRVPEFPWHWLGRGRYAQGFWILSVSSRLASSCATPQSSCKQGERTKWVLSSEVKLNPHRQHFEMMKNFFPIRYVIL